MALTAEERRLRASLASHSSWANTNDWSARTEVARNHFLASFADSVDPNHELPLDVRERRARAALKAHMTRLAYESARARRLNAEAAQPVHLDLS